MANDNSNSSNVVVATYLKPETLADLDECVEYYQSGRAAVIRMALVEFLAAWRRRTAQPAREAATV